MKNFTPKYWWTVSVYLMVLSGWAQPASKIPTRATRLIFFTEDSTRFWVDLNNARQNLEPASLVKIEKAEGEWWIATIDFENEALPSISHKVYGSHAGEVRYHIWKNKRGKYLLRLLDATGEAASHEMHEVRQRLDSAAGSSISRKAKKLRRACNKPLPMSVFDNRRELMRDEPYDNLRVNYARQLVVNECLTAVQVRILLSELSNEGIRLDLARFAYDYVYDPQNYAQVAEGFATTDSKIALSKFLEGRR